MTQMTTSFLLFILILNLFTFSPAFSQSASQNEVVAKAIAENLEIPWALDFLPDGKIVLTERPGRVRLVDPKSKDAPQVIARIQSVTPIGEGGLLGIAVHPHFNTNSWIYLYYTYYGGTRYFNKVVRYQLKQNQLQNPQTIIDHIPGASTHNGGHLKFGPDGNLYITTGDAQQPQAAQDLQSLAGKILRVKPNGNIPADNPFRDSPVYTYGHRNPQGLAWDDQGRLWATEHGSIAHDEINLIRAGQNYGWPLIQGDQQKHGMQTPILHSGNTTWAPSGAAITNGKLYFAGLRGQSLYVFDLSKKTLNRYFKDRWGRLRSVVLGPDGFLYITTSNRDGRGHIRPDDDKVIVVYPDKIKNFP